MIRLLVGLLLILTSEASLPDDRVTQAGAFQLELALEEAGAYSERAWLLEWLGSGRAPREAGISWRGERLALFRGSPDALAEWLVVHDLWRLQPNNRLEPALDLALPLTATDQIHQLSSGLGQDYTGRGVLVGLIDSGIDVMHGDFWEGDDCRILALWDQNADRYWTKADIEAGRVTQRDANGHGTHVAGIAAGNGRSAAGSPAGGPFIGHAPEASIVMVAGSLFESDILQGAEWIFSQADALGMPCVLNLSLESHLGAHDGSSLFEDELEAMSGPGRLIVCAAGNTAEDARHALLENSLPLNLLPFASTAGEDLFIDCWIEGEGQSVAELLLPDGTVLQPAAGSVQRAGWRISFTGPESVGGKSHVLILLSEGRADDSFELRLSHSTVAPRTIHAWSRGAVFANASSDYTVGIPATGDSMLVAGSYVHRSSWTDASGSSWYFPNEVLGQASSFSATGPRVDGREIPHLLMPGQGVFSSLSHDLADMDAYASRLHADGQHLLLQGTSMASPALAGLIALCLERKSDLGPSQLDALLRDTSLNPWHEKRGHGLPDARILLEAIESWFLDFELEPGFDAVGIRWQLATGLPGGSQLLKRLRGQEAELLVQFEAASGEWSWQDEGLLPGEVVRYQMTLLDELGEVQATLESETTSLLQSSGLGISRLYPNPFADGPLYLEILSDRAGEADWRMVNLRGARLAGGSCYLERGQNQLVIQMGALASGTCFFVIRHGDQQAGLALTRR
jgi:subtilisin family serine protease